MKSWSILGAILALGLASRADAAAALANGAQTSCKPTATNPALRQIQINADPFGVKSFQFSISYDPSKVFFAAINPVNGYALGVQGVPTAPQFYNDARHGLLSVRGYWPGSNATIPQYELDVFSVLFEVYDDVSGDELLPFQSLGKKYTGSWQDDNFVGAEYDDDGNFVGYYPIGQDKILSSPLALVSLNGFGVPLPSAAGMGLPGMAMIMVRRRR